MKEFIGRDRAVFKRMRSFFRKRLKEKRGFYKFFVEERPCKLKYYLLILKSFMK